MRCGATRAARLARLLAALPEEHREVLILREFEDMSYGDIACVTGDSDRHGDVAPGARARGVEGDGGNKLRSLRMNCAEVLRVQAYFDGELDAGEAASVRQHLGTCAGCQALLADLERTRATLRAAPQMRAPEHLRTRIDALLDAEPVMAVPRERPRAWRSAQLLVRCVRGPWNIGGGRRTGVCSCSFPRRRLRWSTICWRRICIPSRAIT